MYKLSLRQLANKLASKEISSTELCQYYYQRINHYDLSLNSFITIDTDKANAMAAAADKTLQDTPASLLCGIPMSHKDNFCTQGIKTSCGSKMLDNFTPPYNAHIVELFNASGTVMLGKNNMDEFAMGSSNETSFYGSVKNPWNLNCVPGGSSGGSAAAVAARLIPWATGTDTGGSIRQPAAFCGVTGIKPSYGRISRYGMVAFASSLDQAGALAPCADDLAIILNTMAGHDDKDSTSVNQAKPDFSAQLNESISGTRIGLPRCFFDKRLPTSIGDKVQQCANLLQSLGAELIEIDLDSLDYSIACYYIIAGAEASSNLSRFDGVRFGHRSKNAQNLHELYSKSRSEGFGEEVKRRILTGTYTLSAGYFDDYYVKAQRIRRLIRDDFMRAFEKVDVILGPTTPSTAFELGEKTCDPVTMYLSDIYTIGVNLAGLPALSMPVGFIDDLPVGAQLIGQHFAEAKLLQIAHQYQLNSDWHTYIAPKFDQEVSR